jgi:hypothetical protein
LVLTGHGCYRTVALAGGIYKPEFPARDISSIKLPCSFDNQDKDPGSAEKG